MRQYHQTHLTPRPRPTAPAEPPQLAMLLPVGVHQLHGLTTQPIQFLRLRRPHPHPQRLDPLLVLPAADRPTPRRVGGTLRLPRATGAVLRWTPIAVQPYC